MAIEFHFDYISPYGYFASRSIGELAGRYGREVDWRPMLLGVSVMKVMGLKPLLETPLKGDYVRRDVGRTSRRLGLPLGRDLSQPPPAALVAARATAWAKRHHPEATEALVHSLYDAIWRRGLDLTEASDLKHVAIPAEIDAEELAKAVAGPEASQLLRDLVADSLGRGIFGSPTVIVDGEPFWGFERLGEVDEWLRCGGW